MQCKINNCKTTILTVISVQISSYLEFRRFSNFDFDSVLFVINLWFTLHSNSDLLFSKITRFVLDLKLSFYHRNSGIRGLATKGTKQCGTYDIVVFSFAVGDTWFTQFNVEVLVLFVFFAVNDVDHDGLTER